MANDAVRHINLHDEAGKVYCHKGGAVTELDLLHLSGMCWQCPYWCGLAQGKGVECCYQDENVGPNIDEVTFSNPEDAMQAAPEKPGNLDSIASDDGVDARDARLRVGPDEDQIDQTDNETTPPTQEQAEQGELPPPTPVQASRVANGNAIVQASLQEIQRIMNS